MMDKCDNMETLKLASQLSQARNELNNIRKTLHCARAQHKGDVERLEELLVSAKSLKIKSFSKDAEKAASERKSTFEESASENIKTCNDPSASQAFNMKPIGFLKSIHRQRNGTPRQGMVSSLSRGRLQIEKTIYNNPSHSLQGLDDYSHVWLIYIFHQNTSEGIHAKVSPPRLDGHKLGVFSTRSPHRPNPIGLTLAKLDQIEDDTLLLSGLDLIDGTPVIDVKPYIPNYDSPISPDSERTSNVQDEFFTEPTSDFESVIECVKETRKTEAPEKNKDLTSQDCERSVFGVSENESDHSKDSESAFLPPFDPSSVSIPKWINSSQSGLEVIFNPIAEMQMKRFSSDSEDPIYRLEYLKSSEELRNAIASVLSEDPRSTYRRLKCHDRLYFFMVDSAHITTCFFENIVEVLRVFPPDKESPCYKLV